MAGRGRSSYDWYRCTGDAGCPPASVETASAVSPVTTGTSLASSVFAKKNHTLVTRCQQQPINFYHSMIDHHTKTHSLTKLEAWSCISQIINNNHRCGWQHLLSTYMQSTANLTYQFLFATVTGLRLSTTKCISNFYNSQYQ